MGAACGEPVCFAGFAEPLAQAYGAALAFSRSTFDNQMFVTEAGTDVAMLGIWDADAPTDDVGKGKYKDYQAILEADARDGKLIFINTYSDGGYPMGIVTDRADLPSGILDWYDAVDRALFINTPTGRLVVGGLEDYRSSKPRITSEKDVFEVDPGIYQAFAYQLIGDEERIIDEVKRQVGDDEYEYYSTRPTGCLTASLLIAAGLIVSFFWSWWSLLIAVVLSIAFAAYRTRANTQDERFMAVKRVSDEWDAAHPVILFVLEKVEEMQESDGFFGLDDESAQQDA